MLVTDEKFEIESMQSGFSCHSHLGSGVLNLEVSLINHWVHRKQALVESAHLSGLNWNSKKNTFKKRHRPGMVATHLFVQHLSV